MRWWGDRQNKKAIERGRRLASEREDLIADGVDPSRLVVPLHPDGILTEYSDGDR